MKWRMSKHAQQGPVDGDGGRVKGACALGRVGRTINKGRDEGSMRVGDNVGRDSRELAPWS